jgi:ATP-dependent HslUV protease subunit HslV
MFEATTIVAISRNGQVAIAGDGQVTVGQNTIMKSHARKVRRICDGRVLAGFAGSVADAFTLFGKFEDRLREHGGNLTRAAVETAREWRSDRVLRTLEALLIVADAEKMFLISGSGEVIEPDDGILAIGSGGNYALAAARALAGHSQMTSEEMAREALLIASEICVYTNSNIVVETL